MWWNVNKRLSHVLKYDNNPFQENELDMFFVSETCLGHGSYPVFKDFTTISDPTVKTCQHGGFAWYVKDSLCSHLMGVTYGSSFVAFSLDIFPHTVFVGWESTSNPKVRRSLIRRCLPILALLLWTVMNVTKLYS